MRVNAMVVAVGVALCGCSGAASPSSSGGGTGTTTGSTPDPGGSGGGGSSGSVADAGPDLSQDCIWTGLSCSTGSSCGCTRACGGHLYGMNCSGGACTCQVDGADAGTATAICGDDLAESTGFVRPDGGCGFPGVYFGGISTGSCSGVNPEFVAVPDGCSYEKSCEGNDYDVLCPSGEPCLCLHDGVITRTTSAECSSESSVTVAYANDCGFP